LKQLGALIQLINDGKVSNTIAYQRLFPELLTTKKMPLEIAEAMNLVQSSDGDFLEELVAEVLAKNPDKVKAYQKGKKGLIGFFMGAVMKASKGKAEPKATNTLLAKKLNEK
ncbi:MAG: Asp-tRNA(Asn)/Glu-tRNA(Gln) amidotransferase GatCAB subunit B, partial [Bacteroidota bacterium]